MTNQKLTKFIKWFLCAITIIPWSLVFILFLWIKDTISKIESTKIEVPCTIVVSNDSIDNVSFLDKNAKEGIEEALSFYDIKHKDIVLAQAILETGDFNSELLRKNNNLFGLYNSKKQQYYKFNHWSESIVAYKNMIQNKYTDKYNNYYVFLENINYAEDPKYINKLKQIVKTNNKINKK